MSTLGIDGAEALPVVSFSHFIPQPRLYYGNPRLKAVMGCPELGRQVRPAARNRWEKLSVSHGLVTVTSPTSMGVLINSRGRGAHLWQVEALGSTTHIFGHSHLDVDRELGGTRYVQAALGYPNDRWRGDPLPLKVCDLVSSCVGSLC